MRTHSLLRLSARAASKHIMKTRNIPGSTSGQLPPVLRRLASNRPGSKFAELLEKESDAVRREAAAAEEAERPPPPPPPGPGASEEEREAMAAKLRTAAEAANARKAAAASAKAEDGVKEEDAGSEASQNAENMDADSNNTSASPADLEKFDLLDDDFQELIKSWGLRDPERLGATLADNLIFEINDLSKVSLDDLSNMDERHLRAIDAWRNPSKDEDTSKSSSSSDSSNSNDSSADGSDNSMSIDSIDWSKLSTQATSFASSAWTDIKLSADEIFRIDKDEKVLKKKIHGAAPRPASSTNEEDLDMDMSDQDAGSEIMVVKDGKSAWERLQDRLQEAPLFQELYRRAREAQNSHLGQQAQKTTDQVKDKIEDAREAWETSQNPWVYRISEMWDSMTHETDSAILVRELRRLDPEFSLEEWRENMRDVLVPELISSWLRGDKRFLKANCKSDILKRLVSEIDGRKKAKEIFDPNVLSIDYDEVIVDPALIENMLVCLFVSAQQIHCVRDADTGEVREGSDTTFKQYRYYLVFQREYVEEDGVLLWKLADFQLIGSEDWAF